MKKSNYVFASSATNFFYDNLSKNKILLKLGFKSSHGYALINEDKHGISYVFVSEIYLQAAKDYFANSNIIVLNLRKALDVCDFINQNSAKINTINFFPAEISFNLYNIFLKNIDKAINIEILDQEFETNDQGDKLQQFKKTVLQVPLSKSGLTTEEKIKKIIAKNIINDNQVLLITDLSMAAYITNERIIIENNRIDIEDENCSLQVNYFLLIRPNGEYKKIFYDKLKDTLQLEGREVVVDSNYIDMYMYEIIRLGDISYSFKNFMPTLLEQKAIKTPEEIECFRLANKEEGVSFVKAYFKVSRNNNKFSERELMEAIEEERRRSDHYLCKSFPTIAGIDQNGALIHYNLSVNKTDKINGSRVKSDSNILLVDTGGHYEFATTDTTRVLMLRDKNLIPHNIKESYTMVLKAMISLSLASFSADKASGGDLDEKARSVLLKNSIDYGHSTGHGVGAGLDVHEFPPTISKGSACMITEGMIFSNEPGFYSYKNHYGIRIENVLLVRSSANGSISKKEHSSLGGHNETFINFETLTMVPIETGLISWDMINKEEKEFIMTYNNSVLETLRDRLSEEEINFVKKITLVD